MPKLKAALIGLTLGLALAFGTAAAVFAADKGGESIFADAPVAPPKSGVFAYFGVHGGFSMVDTELSAPGFSFDGIGSKGFVGGVHGGVDYVLDSRIFVGAWASYSWQNTETKLTIGTTSAAIGLEDSWAVGGRVGYDMGKGKIYGLAGWRHTDAEASGALSGSEKLNGIDLGVGAAIALNKNLELDVKGVWTQYKDEKVGGITVSPDQLQILTSLNFKF